jgi:demethylmenaquinone methyltransferase/2-methoxy-6-polyprenyl-1,4-benzoquinol methylase
MKGTPPERAAAGLAPHGTLHDYYGSDEQWRGFVKKLFDGAAVDYDRMERTMAFGMGPWYRRQALLRAGLKPGMRVLDVATGTGLVARPEVKITGDRNLVIGLDPSIGMLSHAVAALKIPAMLALGEQIPLANASVDFLSMGYALRHLADLTVAFREFRRVLKPGGKVCILEMTAPPKGLRRRVMRFYVRSLIPLLSRPFARSRDSTLLWQYFWDTMEACVPPQEVIAALGAAGFSHTERYVEWTIFSEYTGLRE